MNECIRGIVEDLPENYRTMLVLSDPEGLTNAEIVEVLGLTLHVVKIKATPCKSAAQAGA